MRPRGSKTMRNAIPLINATLLLVAGLLLGQTILAEELSRGAMLSASCEGCHGTRGRRPGAIPPLAGRPENYLRETMESFRTGERPATVMGRLVKGYSEEEIRLIAEYFARQE